MKKLTKVKDIIDTNDIFFEKTDSYKDGKDTIIIGDLVDKDHNSYCEGIDKEIARAILYSLKKCQDEEI